MQVRFLIINKLTYFFFIFFWIFWHFCCALNDFGYIFPAWSLYFNANIVYTCAMLAQGSCQISLNPYIGMDIFCIVNPKIVHVVHCIYCILGISQEGSCTGPHCVSIIIIIKIIIERVPFPFPSLDCLFSTATDGGL